MEGSRLWRRGLLVGLVMACCIEPGLAADDPTRVLDYFLGRWEGRVRLFLRGPGEPPQESQGVLENRWVLGGKLLFHEFHGPGTAPGTEFEGLGYLGYDHAAGTYQGTWMDSTSDVTRTGAGLYDPVSRTFSLRTVEGDPRLGRQYRVALSLVDKDHYEYRRWRIGPAGRLDRVLEVDYTRMP